MARLEGGITGRAAGTCAGVQLFSVRRGSGRTTAVRLSPRTPATRSPQQLLYQQRMADIRTFIDTINPTFATALSRIPQPPHGWFNDWMQLISRALTAAPPAITFSATARIIGQPAALPPASFRIIRVSSTALTLDWSYLPYRPPQSIGDRLFFAMFDPANPFNRTSYRFRVITGSVSRSADYYAMTNWLSGLNPACIAFFCNSQYSPTKREPLQYVTID